MSIDITEIVERFRDAIASSWLHVADGDIEQCDSYIDDWLQSSWERLVEARIAAYPRVTLEPYGYGADCNPGSSRVWMPSTLPTHKVLVAPRAGGVFYDVVNEVELNGIATISHFCSLKDGWPEVSAPFDYIALEGAEQAVVSAKNVRFLAQAL